MATYVATIATHQTTGVTAVDEIDLAADAGYVEVLARVNSSGIQYPIYFCVDGVGGPGSDGVPTVGGVDTFVVPALAGAAVRVRSRKTSATVVKVISSGAQAYTVTAVND